MDIMFKIFQIITKIMSAITKYSKKLENNLY